MDSISRVCFRHFQTFCLFFNSRIFVVFFSSPSIHMSIKIVEMFQRIFFLINFKLHSMISFQLFYLCMCLYECYITITISIAKLYGYQFIPLKSFFKEKKMDHENRKCHVFFEFAEKEIAMIFAQLNKLVLIMTE